MIANIEDITTETMKQLRSGILLYEADVDALADYLAYNNLIIIAKPEAAPNSLFDSVKAICSAHNKKITS